MDMQVVKELIIEISMMKVKDLKDRCKDKGIKVPSKSKKLDLVNLVVDLELLEVQVEDVAENDDYIIDPNYDKHLESKIGVSKKRDAVKAEIEQLEVELVGLDRTKNKSQRVASKFLRLEDLKEELEIYNCNCVSLISKYKKLRKKFNDYVDYMVAEDIKKSSQVGELKQNNCKLEKEVSKLRNEIMELMSKSNYVYVNVGNNFDNKKFDILYKKLAVYLHPDKATGNLELMQELNTFRDELRI